MTPEELFNALASILEPHTKGKAEVKKSRKSLADKK